MTVGTVEQLWRYPAKSMMGEQRDAVRIVPEHGIPGDRGWAVRDEERGGIRGAKKIGALMRLAARYVDEPTVVSPSPTVEISCPDGTVVRSDDADVAERLSTALDHRVTLWPLHPADDLDHYLRGPADHDDLLEELRAVFGRDRDEPLPDLGSFPPEILVYESPPGTYFDAYPLLLMTDRSLATLQALVPDADVDVRRFRPNLLIALGDDGPDGDWPEQQWVGRSLTIGSVELDVVQGCPRCVMVTRGFADLGEDQSILRAVVREADQNLGVYATVRRAGTVTVGDGISIAD